jgi:hypothetical protein
MVAAVREKKKNKRGKEPEGCRQEKERRKKNKVKQRHGEERKGTSYLFKIIIKTFHIRIN